MSTRVGEGFAVLPASLSRVRLWCRGKTDLAGVETGYEDDVYEAIEIPDGSESIVKYLLAKQQ